MTFDKAAWAIDGPLTKAALARVSLYASTSGAEGVVNAGDLKVSQLPTPGVGLQIAPGAGLVRNRYQGTNINQTYTVTNPSVHTLSGSAMPPSSPSSQVYVVGVVVGDPEFSQSGHPFMPTTIPAGQESSFTYVRPMILPAATVPGIADGTSGGFNFPFLPLALLVVPPNTTTITNSMIYDLREVTQPRSWLAQGAGYLPGGTLNYLTSTTWTMFPQFTVLEVKVPTWATKVKVIGYIEGLRLDKAGAGSISAYIEGTSLAGFQTNIDEYVPNNQKDRRSYNVGGEIDVTSLRGQTRRFSLRGMVANAASSGFLLADSSTQAMLSLYFEETPT